MSGSLSNKELVTVGHQFAKAMSSDTPIMDMAKMFTRLAERLDCTTAALREMTKHRDALAVENAARGNALKELRSIAFNARRNSHNCGPFQYSDLCESIIDESKPESPATDAFLAEMRAQVWIEAKELAKSAAASDSIDHMDFLFDGKVAQLRQGASS